jgi:hypothetical protein
VGGGATRLTLTLAAFIAGSVLATFHMPFWLTTPSLGEISLGDMLGWKAAVSLQLLAFAAIAGATWWVDHPRPRCQNVSPVRWREWRCLVTRP